MGDRDDEKRKRQVNPAARHDPPSSQQAADDGASEGSTSEVRPTQGAALDPRRPGGIAE
ncbi:MAG: hypothetical protein JWM27_4261 [Gemmatimonadetes bacterium]|nr:hypothetical protein [Gemmatimonadota bacterium]